MSCPVRMCARLCWALVSLSGMYGSICLLPCQSCVRLDILNFWERSGFLCVFWNPPAAAFLCSRCPRTFQSSEFLCNPKQWVPLTAGGCHHCGSELDISLCRAGRLRRGRWRWGGGEGEVPPPPLRRNTLPPVGNGACSPPASHTFCPTFSRGPGHRLKA